MPAPALPSVTPPAFPHDEFVLRTDWYFFFLKQQWIACLNWQDSFVFWDLCIQGKLFVTWPVSLQSMTCFSLQCLPRSWFGFCFYVPFLDSIQWKVLNSAFYLFFWSSWLWNQLWVNLWHHLLKTIHWQDRRKSFRFSNPCKYDNNVLLHCRSRFSFCWSR